MDFSASLSGLAHGIAVASQPMNLLYCLIGGLLGTLIGVLPGIGPFTAVAMLLPISYYLTPEAALIMLAGIYYGGAVRRLHHPPSSSTCLARCRRVVTCLDGYQMARKGRAGPALAVAALGSAFAGITCTIFIALFAPPLAKVALLFGPAEYVSLMILGLVAAIVLARGSVLNAFGMLVLGLLLGAVGTDVTSGTFRMTFGIPELADGIGILPIAMGLFGLAEIIRNLENPEHQTVLDGRITGLWPSMDDFRRCWAVVLRSTGLGAILGLLPGGGAMLASFAAYAFEKKLSKEPERFGHGAVEGRRGRRKAPITQAPKAPSFRSSHSAFHPMPSSPCLRAP